MSRRLLLQVATPAVVIGAVLLVVCLLGTWHISRLEANLASILSENVTSLEAAQELEICVRQLRSHCFVYLVEPTPARLAPVEEDNRRFERALQAAERSATSPEEQACVEAIRLGYQHYHGEMADLRADVLRNGPRTDFGTLSDAHPIRHLTASCHELFRINKQAMEQTAAESQSFSRQARLWLLLMGFGGPAGGLILGYGVARGLRRSIYGLSVRIQDVAQHLDEKVATMNVAVDGDIEHLDQQLQYIVKRVEEVGERIQRHQRQMLRAEQLAAVGQLAAGVAHEVRNPLTSIKLLVEAALRPGDRRPLIEEDLQVIHSEVSRLEQTVRGFLDFARPPAPRRTFTDLRQVANQSVDLVRTRARQQDVAIGVRARDGWGEQDADEPIMAYADPVQLRSVLLNLLLNALDVLPGGGAIDVTLGTSAADGACITVDDTGPGIAPEMAGRLFTPFASTKPAGTGLGLCISKRIIEEHGGHLVADCRLEGGTRFTITLPQAPVGATPHLVA
ncbi:MAG: hypothetical protein K2R98_09295 [Gemmataceae bacterium]|nr:hypothetical protein [Gemmataceae bacterium]